MPMEPLVPNTPVQNLITDESASGMLEPGAQMIDGTVMSNVTVPTSDESTVLVSSAIVSMVSTLILIFWLVSNRHILCVVVNHLVHIVNSCEVV